MISRGPCCLLHAERARALGFADDGYARLWVALEATRAGLRTAGHASSVSLS